MIALVNARALRPDHTIDAQVYAKKVKYLVNKIDQHLVASNQLLRNPTEASASMREGLLSQRNLMLQAITSGLEILTVVPEVSLEAQTIQDRKTLLAYKAYLEPQTIRDSVAAFECSGSQEPMLQPILSIDSIDSRNDTAALMRHVRDQDCLNHHGAGLGASMNFGFLTDTVEDAL